MAERTTYRLPKGVCKTNGGVELNTQGVAVGNPNSKVDINTGALKTANEAVFETCRSTVDGGIMLSPVIQMGANGVSAPQFSMGDVIQEFLELFESDEGLVQINVTHTLQKNDAVWFEAPEYGAIKNCRVARIINSGVVVLNIPYAGESVDGVLYTVKEIGGTPIITRIKKNVRQDKSHKVKKIRTLKTATAIRAGYWNEATGEWSVTPSVAEDLPSMARSGETDSVTANATSRLGLKSKSTVKRATRTNGTITGET